MGIWQTIIKYVICQRRPIILYYGTGTSKTAIFHQSANVPVVEFGSQAKYIPLKLLFIERDILIPQLQLVPLGFIYSTPFYVNGALFLVKRFDYKLGSNSFESSQSVGSEATGSDQYIPNLHHKSAVFDVPVPQYNIIGLSIVSLVQIHGLQLQYIDYIPTLAYYILKY
ncbi:MAG: hypothetical protein EZS28_054647, partial [Streblomastix strix]